MIRLQTVKILLQSLSKGGIGRLSVSRHVMESSTSQVVMRMMLMASHIILRRSRFKAVHH